MDIVRNGYLDLAHVFTLGTTYDPFSTSTQINSTYLLDYIDRERMEASKWQPVWTTLSKVSKSCYGCNQIVVVAAIATR